MMSQRTFAPGTPLVTARVAIEPWRGLFATLRAESFFVAVPIGGLVGGVREIAIEGPGLSLSAGVGVRW